MYMILISKTGNSLNHACRWCVCVRARTRVLHRMYMCVVCVYYTHITHARTHTHTHTHIIHLFADIMSCVFFSLYILINYFCSPIPCWLFPSNPKANFNDYLIIFKFSYFFTLYNIYEQLLLSTFLYHSTELYNCLFCICALHFFFYLIH